MEALVAEDEIWHGGDLAQARALFPDAPEPWIDLSTGINPHPYPLPPLPLSLWRRLPGAAEEAVLLQAARTAYRVPERAEIVAAPGTQILIELLPRLAGKGPVAVPGPTYAEHALAWRKGGHAVAEIASLDAVGDAATLVVVNPNNPDGRMVPREQLAELAERCRVRGGLLVVDEAFCDFSPDASLIPQLPPGALVLRSFGKSYGLAGLRVGFAVGERDMIAALRSALGPWAVAGPALVVAAAALGDACWLEQAEASARVAATRLDGMLAAHGAIVGGTSLFRLLETPHAAALFAHLGRHGVYVRRFRYDMRWLRLGLPGEEAEWLRLEEALASFSVSSENAASSRTSSPRVLPLAGPRTGSAAQFRDPS
jgi:cobalamin biosynthetic protein CobC